MAIHPNPCSVHLLGALPNAERKVNRATKFVPVKTEHCSPIRVFQHLALGFVSFFSPIGLLASLFTPYQYSSQESVAPTERIPYPITIPESRALAAPLQRTPLLTTFVAYPDTVKHRGEFLHIFTQVTQPIQR